jgi:hypothetical protein
MKKKLDVSIFRIIDLLSSEYGWTIEYIQSLTEYEISNLVKCILDRKTGYKNVEDNKLSDQEKLIRLATTIGVPKATIEKIKKGKQIKL